MNSWLPLLLLFSLTSFYASAQEQLSDFITDDYSNNYRLGHVYYSDEGNLRYLLEKVDGEISIYEFQSEEFVLLEKFNDDIQEYIHHTTSIYNDNYIVQKYSDHLKVFDLNTISMWEIQTSYYGEYIADNFLVFGKNGDQLGLLELESEAEITIEGFVNTSALNDTTLVGLDVGLHNVIIYDIPNQVLDTIYRSSEALSLARYQDHLEIDSSLFLINSNSRVLEFVHDSEGRTTSIKRRDEKIYYCSTNGSESNITIYNTVTGQKEIFRNIPEFFLTLHHQFPDSTVIVGVQEYSVRRLMHLDLKTYEVQESFIGFNLPFGDEFFFVDDSILYRYDHLSKDKIHIDTIIDFDYADNLEILDSSFIISNNIRVYTQNQNGGFFPFLDNYKYNDGLSPNANFQVADDIVFLRYHHDGSTKFSYLEADQFKENEELKLHGSGEEKNVYVSDGNSFGYLDGLEFVSLVDEIPQKFFMSEDDSYALLCRYGKYSKLDVATGQVEDLPILDGDNIKVVFSQDSKLLFRDLQSDEYWVLDLEAESLDSIGQFSHRDFRVVSHVSLEEDCRIVFEARETDTRKILGSFNGQSPYEEILFGEHSSSHFLKCQDRNSIVALIEVDGGQSQVWESDGTNAGTSIVHIEDRELSMVKVIDSDVYCFEDSSRKLFKINLESSSFSEVIELDENYTYCDVFRIDSVEFIIQDERLIGNARIERVESGNREIISEFFAPSYYDHPFILPHNLDNARIGLLKPEPFGNELYYIHKNGTLEMLFDLNPGIRSLGNNGIEYEVHDDYLYFIGTSVATGRQAWRFPLDYVSNISNKNLSQEVSLKLYPNPTITDFHVEIGGVEKGLVNWELITLDGKKVLAGIEDTSVFNLDISHLVDGPYYLCIETNGRKYVKYLNKMSNH